MKLSEAQKAELAAVNRTTNEIGYTFIHKMHWRGFYQGMVQRGLVTWELHPEMSEPFRRVAITEAGRAALTKAKPTNLN